jgi:hypothetical protein
LKAKFLLPFRCLLRQEYDTKGRNYPSLAKSVRLEAGKDDQTCLREVPPLRDEGKGEIFRNV